MTSANRPTNATECTRDRSWWAQSEMNDTCRDCGDPVNTHRLQPPADEALTTDEIAAMDTITAELEAEARRAAERADRRASDIAGLRQLANWLEDHPGLEVPYALGGAVFVELAEARAFMAEAPGGWEKKDSGDYWAYDRKFAGRVTYTAYVGREQLCQRVQVGTKTVEAVPEHDEPIYRWECAPVDELDTDAG